MINATEILGKFSNITAEDELAIALRDYVGQLGFDYYSFYLRYSIPATRPDVRIYDSYPDGWMDYYHEQSYLAVDPTLRLSRESGDVLLWSDQTFAGAPSLWSDARSAGLNHGLAQASFGPVLSAGVLTLARQDEAVSASQIDELRMPLMWLSAQLTNAVVRLNNTSYPPAESLTPREIEILQYTLDGKTASELANIKGISARTVNFHIANTLRKLNVSNKTQAAVRAFSLGYLSNF